MYWNKSTFRRVLLRYSAFIGFLATFVTAQAQERIIQGTVTSLEDGSALPGVNVILQGTSQGTVTDYDGKYSIEVPGNATTLVFSYIGYTTREVEIGNQTVIDLTMAVNTTTLEDIVVTALGVERESKALGYSVTEIQGRDLTEARETNLVNSLSGKIAGVQVTNGNSGAGSTSRIVIRGESSFNYSEPLFVVNGVPINNRTNTRTNVDIADNMNLDYGNGAAEISPDDIESISVLKGPSAAALYGSRGANGVVLITTKDGRNRKGLGVSFNAGVTVEDILKSPEYQARFGQGKEGQFSFTDGYGSGTFDGVDESWGPELDGRLIKQFDGPTSNGLRGGDVHGLDQILGSQGVDLERRGEITPTPWVHHGDPVDQFMESGVTQNYNVSLYGSNDEGNFRLSYTHMDNDGILPNTDLRRHNFTLNTGYNLTKKFRVDVSTSYIKSLSNNRAVNGYGTESVMYLFTWYGMQINTNSLKDYWQRGLEGFQQFNYNYNYHDNPYFNMYENTNGLNKNRLMGNVKLSYQFTEELSVSLRTGTDYYDELREIKRAYSTQRFPRGQYREDKISFQEVNTDVLVTYNKKISSDWQAGISLGANRMVRKNNFNALSANQLVIPGYYNFSNTDIPLVAYTSIDEKQINSAFGMMNFAFKNMIFLDITGRNDWSSKLASGNNSYFYPSVSASAVLSDMVQMPNMISFFKLRASWAQAGNDTDEWALDPVFNLKEPFGSNLRGEESTVLPNPELENELSSSIEVGTDLRLFNGRVGLDLTYFNSTTENQIVPIVVPHSTGYAQKFVNLGKIINQGWEVMLNISPIQSDNFRWDAGFNFFTSKNKIEGLGGIEYAIAGNRVTLIAKDGGSMGDMYGTGLLKVAEGEHAGEIIFRKGLPIEDPELRKLGNYNPDFILGFNNDFNFKGINFGVLIDWRQGGDLVSLTRLIAATSGNIVETLPGRTTELGGVTFTDDNGNVRTDGIIGAGVKEITDAEGNVTGYETNDYPVAASAYYNKRYKRENEEEGMYDATFVKLREVRLGYTLPDNLFGGVLKDVKLSFVGRNLALWNNFNHGDSELLSYTGGGQTVVGVEDMAIPSTRSYGFNISAKF
jgi:TonB-linked SusC/RagA family outer membrane protein